MDAVGSAGLGDVGDPNCADAVPGAQRERVRRTVRALDQGECLSRVIPFGERHLRRTLAEFIEHYHRERNHQGLGNELIDGVSPMRGARWVRRRERLGGLLNYYYRAA